MRQLINKSSVDGMNVGTVAVDTKIDGFVARKLRSGKVTYGFRYRDQTRRQRWISLGVHGQSGITAESARAKAKVLQGNVAAGKDPGAEKRAIRDAAEKARIAGKNTVNAVLDLFVARHVKNLRSAKTVERSLEVYVRPRIGSKSIYDLKRRDIVEMLDAIEDADKAVTADRVLAYVRKAFNWYATRDDEFSPPIVRGMARTKPSERARTRALADDEIRSLWTALDLPCAPEPFPNIVRVLLLTAQRKNEIGLMRVEEIDGGTLVIPAERYKTGIPNAVPLTTEARQWIGDRRAGFVFSTTGGKRPFNGYSKAKRQLDNAIAAQRKLAGLKPMPAWRLHDLRRTARSLMSRAGVPSDIAEMVLGHKLGGVRGVYDRHSYAAEKRDALERLGQLVGHILIPPGDNLVKTCCRTP